MTTWHTCFQRTLLLLWQIQPGSSGLWADTGCRGLAARYRMPMELAVTLASLALYDIVIFCDDSGRHLHFAPEALAPIHSNHFLVSLLMTLCVWACPG